MLGRNSEFSVDSYVEYFNSLLNHKYLDHYFPDINPLNPDYSTEYRKNARTTPYIVDMALELKNQEYLNSASSLVQPILYEEMSHPIFNPSVTFDRKFYEFSPDTREATFKAAMLNQDNNEISEPLINALIEEVRGHFEVI